MATLEKTTLLKSFALRLRNSLIAAGYHSTRSPSGVDIHRFSVMTGYSPQICRKYLRGQALPESSKLVDIAEQLNVSPGWLLFGDCHSSNPGEHHKITISKDLLHYIFSHVSKLSQPDCPNALQLSNLFLTLTADISQMNADPDQSKKIVDLALFSARKLAELD